MSEESREVSVHKQSGQDVTDAIVIEDSEGEISDHCTKSSTKIENSA